MTPIYLDYNATTPLDPAVVESMLPFLREHYGNPSSTHSLGKTAHNAVEQARQQVAQLLGAPFGGDHLHRRRHGSEQSRAQGVRIRQITRLLRPLGPRRSIIISAVEHPSTTQPCEFLKRLGCRITVVPVDGTGRVDADAVRKAMVRGWDSTWNTCSGKCGGGNPSMK